MVNNNDKSKGFFKNDFHVGGNPWADIFMSPSEPKHHRVKRKFCHSLTQYSKSKPVSHSISEKK
jgi:hypothetical protein